LAGLPLIQENALSRKLNAVGRPPGLAARLCQPAAWNDGPVGRLEEDR